jgi:general secretion pathway protein J
MAHALNRQCRSRRQRQRAFTLIEVLVALFIMAIMAGMAWQGIDGLVRVRDGAQRSAEQTLQLSNLITQWEQDLAHVQTNPGSPAIRFDGTAMRLTRGSADGLQIVVWMPQGNTLFRWASPPLTRLQDTQDWIVKSAQWASIRSAALPMLEGMSEWQVYYYRPGDNTWSNAQSSGGAPGAPRPAPGGSEPDAPDEGDSGGDFMPSGVRLVLTTAAGSVQRDVLMQSTN